ncbi:MAG TPA: sigma-70 family RNA polymerase sigma factor [Candidatus Methylomirabilis sp.]|nr:sigma-70 family RNA polymerase sigma factor [Candidatus Methylomirabilis sp.]
MGPDEQDRKRQEFEEAALVHMNSVYNAALRLTRNKTEAEDLFQETFLRAYRFFHQLRRESNCRAWLFAILHRLFISRVRQASPAVVDFEEERAYREADSRCAPLANPEVDLVRRMAGEDIRRAIATLPPKLRAVVVMADLEGCSYREIAEICEVPIGTVMSRLYRGRQALRASLKRYAEGGRGAGKDP